MLVGAYSHEGGTHAQRQVLGFIYLLIFGGKYFILVFLELFTNVEVVKYIH
jgi:hypothetical protein